MKRKRDLTRPFSMGMAPMVDVVLLLIIFFLLASKFKGEEAELLSLPFARQAEPAYRQVTAPQFVINIAPALINGRKAAVYIYQGMQFDPEEPEEMKELLDKLRVFRDIFKKDGRVVIRADKRVYAQYVVRFQEKCAGIKEVQYATAAAQEE